MLRRKIEKTLLEWKSREDRLPLIIEGARQVGKTTSVEEFAAQHYDCLYELNFYEHPELVMIFDAALDPDTILSRLSLNFPDKELVPGSTLIFLDEIQHCPNARTALKFLARDKRFDVIASGSLLGLNFSQISSVPVGYTETIKMYPLDFEEFLWAMGINENIIQVLRNAYDERKPVDAFMHESMLGYFSTFIVVGGMPAVVSQFAKDRNFATAGRIQKNIIEDYRKDVIKYASDRDKGKILRCMDSIPSQLAKDYKKFQYSVVEKGAGSSKYAIPLQWLEDACMVSYCHNLSLLEPPLKAYEMLDVFKVYMNDTGLLVSMYGGDCPRQLIEGNLGIFKGAIYENIIASSLVAHGFPLYYFSPHSTLEIDFVINYQGRPCLVEVKSGENNKSKSLKTVLENPKYKVDQAIRFSRRNVGQEGKILSLPLYMVMFLENAPEPMESHLPSSEDLLEAIKG